VRFGAPEDILFAAHPHIGTFKLVKVVEGLREEIIRLGGEVRFEQRVVDIEYAPTDREKFLMHTRKSACTSHTIRVFW
jgi:uncharacterized FAD-dependent dehydrogenase